MRLAMLGSIGVLLVFKGLTGGNTPVTVASVADLRGDIAMGVIGVLAVSVLWQRDSSAYFAARVR